MSTQVQYRRGSSTQNDAFTGALAEITVDTTNKTIRVHDGSTAGGSNIATVSYVTAQLAALSANAITFGTSNVQIPSSGSNIRVNVGGTSNVAVFSTAGVAITGNITSGSANATANIGSASTYFNTVHAKATSAQYADVAEYYASDADYEPGTVVVFGGSNEITISTQNGDDRVAGVISTNPAYIMNAGLQCEHAVAVALSGRVPTRVIGPVTKGNMMVSAGNGYAQACATPAVGTVIGKSLENFSGTTGVIEVVVGRM